MRHLRDAHCGLGVSGVLLLLLASVAAAQEPPRQLVPIERFVLDNGMAFLLVDRPESPTVSAGWVASVGSADDPEGYTGLSHMLEHMMFKGTRTLGTRDLTRDLKLLDREDALWDRILELRNGGVNGAEAEASRLTQELDELIVQGRSIRRSGELDILYASSGASGLNAVTQLDATAYFVSLPPEKLELWFWLESDRLHEPVFREFHVEKQVALEERRLRVESTPTGRLEEELRVRLWGGHPYGRPGIGRPEDLERLGRPDARRHFAAHYGANNLTAVLVGPINAGNVLALAERYFGRLAPGQEPQAARTPPEAIEPSVLERDCDCRPQARALYRAVEAAHPDAPALEMLVGLLNGRTGRLHRSLVLDQGLAFSAYSQFTPLEEGGVLSLIAEAKSGTPPAQLLAALDREVERLLSNPPDPREIDKVRNQLRANAFRRLKEPSELMMELLLGSGKGDVAHLESWLIALEAVDEARLQEVATRYLTPEARVVGLFDRTADLPAEADVSGSLP
jgi:predicted Zn-dependent peptidase